MIQKLYFWFWSSLLHLPKPISYLVVENIRANQLVWQLIGAIVLAVVWTLIIHFIAIL